MRVGLFGGTFNPVHRGHLLVAQDAVEAFDLARVLFVPCERPPHKEAGALVSAAHRVAMLEAALEGNERFEVCDLEIRRGGTTYSIDTVRELKKLQSDTEWVFIIGADTLLELHQWKEIDALLELCRFVTLARPGFDLKNARAETLKLKPPWPARLLQDVARGHQMEIASSDIRHRVAEGMSIKYLVPYAVEMYIAEHALYNT